MLKIRAVLLSLVMFSAMAPWAHATLITLNQSQCCGSGPFGTVSVVQGANSNTVNVTVTLTAGEVFANTGAGDALGFDVNKAFTLVPGSLTAGFNLGGADHFTFAGS